MNRSPFITVLNVDRLYTHIHHAAVVYVEQSESGGSFLRLRVGNSSELYETVNSHEEVMKELERARRAEIVSFGE